MGRLSGNTFQKLFGENWNAKCVCVKKINKEVIFLKEQWKDIDGFLGYYQISNFGRVKSLCRKVPHPQAKCGYIVRNEKIKKPKTDSDGYKVVCLQMCGNKRYVSVHRLVAEAFIPNPNKYLEINHKDYNRTNNRVDNLEWITHKDNVRYSSDIGKYSVCKLGDKNGKSKSVDLYKNDNLVKSFSCIKNCSEWIKTKQNLKGSINAISGFIARRAKCNKHCYGYIAKINTHKPINYQDC